ncbi:hypothetical protein DACRYDRAFT_95041 [Dacryopinax primogenitus]|uniref:UspA domain-containing protein n=1 Tax=Dacryopinax primogenitus (strain DJM 731) TaxID=1858805 RepID=M5GBK6_DACPD|nr:uncharacterized protein DACRYDRAFT_95041 [Dacryopinax primogenitus]EJU01388.1 hypothetical protein DACRYDRAFT_95041 [Dacryopinax primogenitus]
MAGYKSGVSFDTMGESTTELFSYTLQAKSENYERSRKTRIYLCAASPDESGQEALDWSVETLAQDGDELIVLRGFDTEDAGKQDLLRSQAHQLLLDILERNTQLSDGTRSLNVTVEFVAGRITDTIERLIALYRPDSLVVGTRARKGMKALGAALGAPGMGSVSRWCVSHSPVPVIVVRPERKVKKTLDKRRNDPKRAQDHWERVCRPTSGKYPAGPQALMPLRTLGNGYQIFSR